MTCAVRSCTVTPAGVAVTVAVSSTVWPTLAVTVTSICDAPLFIVAVVEKSPFGSLKPAIEPSVPPLTVSSSGRSSSSAPVSARRALTVSVAGVPGVTVLGYVTVRSTGGRQRCSLKVSRAALLPVYSEPWRAKQTTS